jgi:hypothetical protein
MPGFCVIHPATTMPASYNKHNGMASINCDTTSGCLEIEDFQILLDGHPIRETVLHANQIIMFLDGN